MKAFFGILTLGFLTICSCSKQITKTSIDNHIIIEQEGGKTLGYSPESGVKILEIDGFCFKDLNKNGTLKWIDHKYLGGSVDPEKFLAEQYGITYERRKK